MTATVYDFIREKLVRMALAPICPSIKKRRLMSLYEERIITAGDVERLFQKYELSGA